MFLTNDFYRFQSLGRRLHFLLLKPQKVVTVPEPDNADARERRPPSWQFDRTVNIPTLMGVMSLVAGIAVFGVRASNDFDRRLDAVTRDTVQLRSDVRRVEDTQAAQGAAQGLQVQSLRIELRSDLKDVNEKLDKLLFDRGSAKPPTGGWTR